MTRERVFDILEGDSKASVWCERAMTALIIASLAPLCFWEKSMIFDVLECVCVTAFILATGLSASTRLTIALNRGRFFTFAFEGRGTRSRNR